MRFATMVAQASTRMPENLKEALRLAALANGDSMSAVIRRAIERECRYQIRRLGRRR
jgi:predicted DNA-binding protein